MSDSPRLSVVVPTAGRPRVLEPCLAALAEQDQPRESFEVVVVIDGEDEASEAIVARAAENGLPARAVTRQDRGGPGAARNTGIREARGELICFLDDDALAWPGWLSSFAAGARRHPEAGMLAGPVRPRYDVPPPRTCAACEEIAGATLDCGPDDVDVDEAWGCNMAIRRTAIEQIGGFDESLVLSEDWDWCHRLLSAGGRIVYIPDAGIWHLREASDLRLRTIPREFVHRGWIVGRRRDPVDVRSESRTAWRLLRHALSARCARGLTEGSRSLGFLLAALVPRRAPAPPRRS